MEIPFSFLMCPVPVLKTPTYLVSTLPGILPLPLLTELTCDRHCSSDSYQWLHGTLVDSQPQRPSSHLSFLQQFQHSIQFSAVGGVPKPMLLPLASMVSSMLPLEPRPCHTPEVCMVQGTMLPLMLLCFMGLFGVSNEEDILLPSPLPHHPSGIYEGQQSSQVNKVQSQSCVLTVSGHPRTYLVKVLRMIKDVTVPLLRY